MWMIYQNLNEVHSVKRYKTHNVQYPRKILDTESASFGEESSPRMQPLQEIQSETFASSSEIISA